MALYDLRTHDAKETLHILASNGLSITLETSVRYRPERETLPKLHASLGPRYFESIVAPSMRSASAPMLWR